MGHQRIGVAVLTMGTRPVELARLLNSVAMQDTPATRVVVVGDGTPLPPLPDGVTGVELPENLGVSGGRNVALDRLREFGDVDLVVDLDDDGLLIAPDVFTRLVARYEADARLGIVGFRIADERGRTQRRHVPRLRAADPMRGGPVTTFLGGGHALSARMLDETGGWPEAFFYAHEETDLAWRALDAGWKVLYDPEVVLQHPWTAPTRHARLPPHGRPQPGVAGEAASARSARARVPGGVDRADARPDQVGGRDARVVWRLRGGAAHAVSAATADAVGHGVADDQAGTAPGRLNRWPGVGRLRTVRASGSTLRNESGSCDR